MAQVKGIGDDAPDGWVLEEYELPLPKGLNNIMDAIKQVLGSGKIQSLTLELGRPIVFTKFVKEGEAEAKRQVERAGDASLGSMARNILMEEYPHSNKKPHEVFFEMLLALSARRVHLTHIGIGPESRFYEWMGFDHIAYGAITHLAGAELARDGELPNDSMIFFAGPQQGGRVDQSTYALKCHMLMPEDLQQEEPDVGQGPENSNDGSGDRAQGGRLPDGAVADDARGVSGPGGRGGPAEGQQAKGGPRAAAPAHASGDRPRRGKDRPGRPTG